MFDRLKETLRRWLRVPDVMDFVKAITALRGKPGDVVLLQATRALSRQQMEQMRLALDHFAKDAGIKFVILGPETTVAAIVPGDGPRARCPPPDGGGGHGEPAPTDDKTIADCKARFDTAPVFGFKPPTFPSADLVERLGGQAPEMKRPLADNLPAGNKPAVRTSIHRDHAMVGKERVDLPPRAVFPHDEPDSFRRALDHATAEIVPEGKPRLRARLTDSAEPDKAGVVDVEAFIVQLGTTRIHYTGRRAAVTGLKPGVMYVIHARDSYFEGGIREWKATPWVVWRAAQRDPAARMDHEVVAGEIIIPWKVGEEREGGKPEPKIEGPHSIP